MLNLTASTQEIALHLMKLRGQNTIAVVHNYGKFVVHVPLSQQFNVFREEYDIWLKRTHNANKSSDSGCEHYMW